MIRSVCIITRDYPPDVDPTPMSRTFEALARGLAELGIAVHVITRDGVANEGRLHRVPRRRRTSDTQLPLRLRPRTRDRQPVVGDRSG